MALSKLGRQELLQHRRNLDQAMPIYEYTCNECTADFEALVMGSEKPECPKCQSKKLTKQLSVISSPSKAGTESAPQVCDPLPGGG